jgi:hypothetical protein
MPGAAPERLSPAFSPFRNVGGSGLEVSIVEGVSLPALVHDSRENNFPGWNPAKDVLIVRKNEIRDAKSQLLDSWVGLGAKK